MAATRKVNQPLFKIEKETNIFIKKKPGNISYWAVFVSTFTPTKTKKPQYKSAVLYFVHSEKIAIGETNTDTSVQYVSEA